MLNFATQHTVRKFVGNTRFPGSPSAYPAKYKIQILYYLFNFQLLDEGDEEGELAAFSMLLPAAPVLDVKQVVKQDNETTVVGRM